MPSIAPARASAAHAAAAATTTVPLCSWGAGFGLIVDAAPQAQLELTRLRLPADTILGGPLMRARLPAPAVLIVERGVLARHEAAAPAAPAAPLLLGRGYAQEPPPHTTAPLPWLEAVTDVEVAALPLHTARRLEAEYGFLSELRMKAVSAALFAGWSLRQAGAQRDDRDAVVHALAAIARTARLRPSGEGWTPIALAAADLAALLGRSLDAVARGLLDLAACGAVRLAAMSVCALDLLALSLLTGRRPPVAAH